MKKLITFPLIALSLSCVFGCSNAPTSSSKTFSDITFSDASFTYDGSEKSIYVDGVPEFATVTYEGNSQINAGIYNVTARIRATDYYPLDLNATLTINKAEFENITFSDASFTYDGTEKYIYASGVPDFASITYEGNNQIDAGTYIVKAHITAENYMSLDLSARLTILNANFTNITFDGQMFDYDGEPHSIYISGAPTGASVTYTNNNKIDAGTYTVTAKVSMKNYNTLTLSATLRIVGKEITGVTFDDQTFEYDGKSHSIEVSGELPKGVSVNYSNNSKIDAGSYEVSATLTGKGYEKLVLKAKLIIKPVEIEKPGYFNTSFVIYDGKNHSLTVSNPPSGATITYKCLNASGTNTFSKPGQYDIEATVKINNNHLSVLKASLFIVEEGTIGVDQSKSSLTIDENLKWDDLYQSLCQDNFTYDYFSGSYDVENIDDPYPSDLLKSTCENHTLRVQFACDGKEAYSKSYSTYSNPYYIYDFYTEVGDDIAYFHLSESYPDYNKFPKSAFSETVSKPNAANAFVALEKGDNGEFLVGMDRDDYYKDNGYPFIEDGKFIVLMQHPRTLSSGEYRYFYEVYEFYNIGNTKLTIPNSAKPSSNFMKNNMSIGDYRLGGVKYSLASYGSASYMKTYYSAELYVSYTTKLFLKPGTYTVLPYIYDHPVMAIVHYNYYQPYYNYNQSGYTFNLYVDEEGIYQDEYADIGSLARFTISEFLSAEGQINYYSDWHQ